MVSCYDRLTDVEKRMDQRFNEMEKRTDPRFAETRELLRSGMYRMEQVIDARLRHLEDRIR